MIYTKEEKRRMDRLVEAFGVYIRSNDAFEILYSDKLGYLTIDIHGGEAEDLGQIEDFDALLKELFFQISSDVRDLKLVGEHKNNNLFPVEIVETRRRAEAILNTLTQDKEYCFESLDYYLRQVND